MNTRCPGRIVLWLVLAFALLSMSSQALQFASMLPQCTAMCDPPKHCAFVSRKLVCRDGCWANRCPSTQRCVQKQCTDPSTGCSQAVRCVDPRELISASSSAPAPRHHQCSQDDHAACDTFQRCVPTFPGYMCADICDPKRCPVGISCQLEPPVDCTAEPCLPMAVCIDPDDQAMH